MNEIKQLLENNRKWSEKGRESAPAFFESLVARQTPRYLWLGHVSDLSNNFEDELNQLSGSDKVVRLCEINVLEQAENVCRNSIVVEAISGGPALSVHSLIYRLKNGLLKDLSQTT